MTGVAGYVGLPIGESCVDVSRYPYHIARHVLLSVVIAGEISLDVTIVALDPKRAPERAHDFLYVRAGG
jgi:hypothetical protein